MVQGILTSIGSDNVNSINDTIEAFDVAVEIKETYDYMIATRDWAHLHKITQLDGLSNVDQPTHMLIPDGFKEVEHISYNIRKADATRDSFTKINYLPTTRFLEQTNSRDSSKDNVDTVIDIDGAPLFILNDVAPQWWTSFDDEHIIFDSYDSAIDTTLNKSKTQVKAIAEPTTFLLEDSFIPDLPSKAFPALFNEAKSTVALDIDGEINVKAEQRAKHTQSWLSRKDPRTRQGMSFNTNFGRGRGFKSASSKLGDNQAKPREGNC